MDAAALRRETSSAVGLPYGPGQGIDGRGASGSCNLLSAGSREDADEPVIIATESRQGQDALRDPALGARWNDHEIGARGA